VKARSSPAGVPLGTAHLADAGVGFDPSAFGYREREYLVVGSATARTYDRDGTAAPGRTGLPPRRDVDATRVRSGPLRRAVASQLLRGGFLLEDDLESLIEQARGRELPLP
jgi:hypothetical protein